MIAKAMALLLLGALLAVPGATAQAPTGMTLTGPNDALTVGMSGETLTYTVTIGCGEFVQQTSPSLAVTLATDLPDYFGASSEGATFAPDQNCLTGAGFISEAIDLKIQPTADAIGLEPASFTITAATTGLTATFDHSEAIQVEYVDGHTISTDVAFPYEYTAADGDELVFNVTIDVSANSKTMVMFENLGAGGSVDGLFHQIFDFQAGDNRSRVVQVTYSPPAGSWTNDTISFYNYSHCLNGSPCGPTNEANVTWQINNAGGSTGDGGGDEESPGLPVLGLGLVLAAMAMIRRRS